MIFLRRQDLKSMDDSQGIKEVADFEGGPFVGGNLATAGAGTEESACCPRWDVTFDNQFNRGVLAIRRAELRFDC